MRRLVVLVPLLAAFFSGCGSGSVGDAGDASVAGSDAVTPSSDSSDVVTTHPPPVDTGPPGALVTYGGKHDGGEFHLGPVDWDETAFHNACAPGTKYAPAIRASEGALLAGLWNGIPNVAGDCDACIFVTTAKGKSALLRVVTYGDTTPNSIDVSPEAFAILNSGESPRLMSWQFAKCNDSGPIVYEFQTGSNEWWTSLWVRNARVPLAKVEVQSKNHPSFVELTRGGDGTLTDGGGFGNGTFTLRLTGVDGTVLTDTFPFTSVTGVTLASTKNFP